MTQQPIQTYRPLLRVVLLVLAVLLFLLAAFGLWPDDWRDDIEPVALGLACLAGAFLAA